MKSRIETPAVKRSAKQEREFRILLGLVDYYLKTGKPVGSNTLKDAGFEDLSSATIRNYFTNLEESGYLTQQHSSGGRIPTHLAYKAYAKEYLYQREKLEEKDQQSFKRLHQIETREIASFLQEAAETLSFSSQMAVFLSAPRFDQDMIIDVKIIPIDRNRCLCVIITDFGTVQTEVMHIESKLTALSAQRIESYIHWRLTGNDLSEKLEESEEQMALQIYNELMIRYIVRYSNFIDAEIYRTGFSKLLAYPDLRESPDLANTLALFENTHNLRLLVKDCCKRDSLRVWIGDDLSNYSETVPNCSIIAVPYHINQSVAGAIGILGPTRMAYREMFEMAHQCAESISASLTRNIFKFKISFRQPESKVGQISKREHSHLMLIDAKPSSK